MDRGKGKTKENSGRPNIPLQKQATCAIRVLRAASADGRIMTKSGAVSLLGLRRVIRQTGSFSGCGRRGDRRYAAPGGLSRWTT